VKIDGSKVSVIDTNLTKENTLMFDFQWIVHFSFIISIDTIPFKPFQNIIISPYVVENSSPI
jgi:hypothetical protein